MAHAHYAMLACKRWRPFTKYIITICSLSPTWSSIVSTLIDRLSIFSPFQMITDAATMTQIDFFTIPISLHRQYSCLAHSRTMRTFEMTRWERFYPIYCSHFLPQDDINEIRQPILSSFHGIVSCIMYINIVSNNKVIESFRVLDQASPSFHHHRQNTTRLHRSCTPVAASKQQPGRSARR